MPHIFARGGLECTYTVNWNQLKLVKEYVEKATKTICAENDKLCERVSWSIDPNRSHLQLLSHYCGCSARNCAKCEKVNSFIYFSTLFLIPVKSVRRSITWLITMLWCWLLLIDTHCGVWEMDWFHSKCYNIKLCVTPSRTDLDNNFLSFDWTRGI